MQQSSAPSTTVATWSTTVATPSNVQVTYIFPNFNTIYIHTMLFFFIILL
jgi:hypothetical protein